MATEHSMADSMKRKKKMEAKNGQEGDVIKKKRKIEVGDKKAGKLSMEKTSGGKSTDGKSSPSKQAGEKRKKPKPERHIATKSPKKDMSKDGDGKTMDYKQFHLKKMKEKWKTDKGKRRQGKTDKKAAAKKQAPSKSSVPKSLKEKEKEFGTCDFLELLYRWSEFAASNLTAVEQEELLLAPRFVFSNKNSRTPNRFFSKRIPNWKEWTERKVPNGSPQIIIICPSDVRAVALNRDLADFKGDCRTAKLIPKEKAKEQAEKLSKGVVHLAIGTPHRIESLISHGSLKLGECCVVALDWSFKDTKQRRLITIPELRVDILEMFRKHFIPMFKARDEVALVLF